MNNYDRTTQEPLLRQLKLAGADVSRPKAICCPFHDDQSASSGIYKGKDGVWRFKCQVPTCGVGGDVYDIESKRTGKSIGMVMPKTSHNYGNGRSVAKGFATGSATQDAKPGVSERKPAGKPLPPKPPILTKPGKKSGGARPLAEIEADWQDQGFEIVSRHYYRDENDTKNILQVVRLYHSERDDKSYRQMVPAKKKDGCWLEQGIKDNKPLYNLHRIKKANVIIVVEGEKCADYLNSLSDKVCATTSSGGSGGTEGVDWTPLYNKKVIVWPDNDDPGRKYAIAIENELFNHAAGLKVLDPGMLQIEEKGADCYDYFTGKSDSEALGVLECLGTIAKDRSPIGRMLQRNEDIVTGKWSAVNWPWPILTQKTKSLLPSTITVICGEPGASKSFFILQALKYWHDQGIPCAVYEMEDDNTYHLYRALAQTSCNNKLTDIEYIKENPTAVPDAIRDNPGFENFGRCIYESNKGRTAKVVVDWIKKRLEAGVRVVVVDPISLLTDRTDAWTLASDIMEQAEYLVRKHEASLILVTHPKQRNSKTFSMEDIAGGSTYQRASHSIIWLQRHDDPKESQITGCCGTTLAKHNRTLIFMKARNGPGVGARIAYQFNGYSLTFEEIGPIQKKDKR